MDDVSCSSLELAATMVRAALMDAGEKTKFEFLATAEITFSVRNIATSFCFFIAFSTLTFEIGGGLGLPNPSLSERDLRLLVICSPSSYSYSSSSSSLRERDLWFQMC